MSTPSEVLRIILQADDQASRVIHATAEAASGFSSRVQDLAAPFADVADQVLKAEAALVALAGVIATQAIREAIEFEGSMASVQRQLGETGVSLEEARADIQALGREYGINSNEVANAVANFLAAGFDYQTASDLVRTSTRLMIAGQLEAQTSTDAITRSLAGFRVPAGEAGAAAEHIGDVLNKIGDISSGAFEEIVTGFSRISPTAKDAGLSMEETASAIAVLVDVFGSGEIASTALKSGLLSLLSPSTEASAALSALGVANTDSNGQLRQSSDLLADLAGKWGTLTDAQRQQTAAVIFGKDQAGAMSALLGNWGQQQSYVAQLADKTTGAVGSMGREVDVQLQLISTRTAQTTEAWRNFQRQLGQRITDQGYGELVDALGTLGDAFKEVVDTGGLDPLLTRLRGTFGEITSLTETIAANLPQAFESVDWSNLTEALDNLSESLGGIFRELMGDIDLRTVEGLSRAIQLVVDSIASLTNVTAGIVREFQPFAAAIRAAILNFNELDSSSQIEFGQALGAMKLLVDAGTGLGLALIAIGRAGLDMQVVLDGAFGAVRVAINSLQVAFDSALLGILSIAQAGLGVLGFQDQAQELERLMDAVAANGIRNAGELEQGWQQMTGGARDGTEQWRASLDRAEQALLGAKDATGQVTEKVGDLQGLTAKEFALQVSTEEAVANLDRTNAAFDDLIPKFGQPIDLNFNAADAAQQVEEVGQAAEVTGVKMRQVVDATGQTVTVFEGVGTAAARAKGGVDAAGNAMSESAVKTQEALEAARDYEIKMEEIASNERIRTIEAFVELNVAQLEADAQRVEATFASIDNVVSSTGDLLGSLFDNFVNADAWDQLKLQKQIDLENKRRQEALDLQKKLAAAEIERIAAQTAALNRGDALIKIEGAGLEPELEAFMWRILENVRVRANAEFTDYLLGMGVSG